MIGAEARYCQRLSLLGIMCHSQPACHANQYLNNNHSAQPVQPDHLAAQLYVHTITYHGLKIIYLVNKPDGDSEV